MAGVSRWLGISARLIHGWRKTRRKSERIASKPLQFITYGVVADVAPPEPVVALAPSAPAERKFGVPARKATTSPGCLGSDPSGKPARWH